MVVPVGIIIGEDVGLFSHFGYMQHSVFSEGILTKNVSVPIPQEVYRKHNFWQKQKLNVSSNIDVSSKFNFLDPPYSH